MRNPSSVAFLTPLIMIMLSGCTGCSFLDLWRLPDGNTIIQEVEVESVQIVEDEIERNESKPVTKP